MSDEEVIRTRLNAAFERYKVSNAEVARHCGVTEQAVGRWRRTGQIARKNIPNISAFFGESPSWLLDDMTDLSPPQQRYGSLRLSERDIRVLEAMRRLSPTIRGTLEDHILALSKKPTDTIGK